MLWSSVYYHPIHIENYRAIYLFDHKSLSCSSSCL